MRLRGLDGRQPLRSGCDQRFKLRYGRTSALASLKDHRKITESPPMNLPFRFTALTALLILQALPGCAVPETRVDIASAANGHRVLLLGEVHDNAAQHALRLEAFKGWLARGQRPALLLEQFDRERQPEINRLRAQTTKPDADAVIAAGRPAASGWNWAFYKPFIELALAYDLPIVAANVSRSDAQAVIGQGLTANGFEAEVPGDIRAAHAATIEASHCGMVDDAMAGRMALAQIARDQFMARAVEAQAGRGVLLLAGNGHVRKDVGVPRWLTPRTREQSVSIGLLEQGDDAMEAFDQVVLTPR